MVRVEYDFLDCLWFLLREGVLVMVGRVVFGILGWG